MFYIDGISLHKIKDELKEDLLRRKVTKINKNNENSLSIIFGKVEFIISTNPSFPICYVSEAKEDILDSVNSASLSIFRKKLMSSILIDIKQLDFDRILVFRFSKVNELGEVEVYELIFEMTGKRSNIILTDKYSKIIEAWKKFSLDENSLRPIFPGINYEKPSFSNKISPIELSEEEFYKLKNSGDLIEKVEGLGKLISDNVNTFEEFKNILDSDLNAKIYFNEEKIKLATFIDIKPKDFTSVKEFSSYKEAVNFYIRYEQVSNSFSNLKNKLFKIIQKRIKKYEKILSMVEKDIENSKDFIKYKEEADILAASLYSVKKGMSSLEAFDFYNNKNITIELDSFLSPNENLEKTYKKYNKIKRSFVASSKRLEDIKEYINYYESIKLFIMQSKDMDNLKGIEEELLKEGIIKEQKKNKKAKKVKIASYGVLEADNYSIFYGRNNIENDYITFKLASKEDFWFHSKNIPGSHVILKSHEVNDDIIFKCCQVAAFLSKANIGDKLLVDYTLKKYINKPNNSKPGFVTYKNEKSMLVEKQEIEL